MRTSVFAMAMMMVAHTAMAEVSASSPGSYAARLDEENRIFLKQLTAKVRETGYRDVQVVPQIFIVKATDKSGRAVTLLVNSGTNQAVEIDGVPPGLVETVPETSLIR
jgi:hypothetical protein